MDKILKLQSEIGVLSKTETNPFFKSKYFDVNSLIAQLMPLLEKYGLTVIQPLSHIDGKPALRTIVCDAGRMPRNGEVITLNKNETLLQNDFNGVYIDSTIPLPDLQDPQKMGSAITYYRRYALQSLFLLQAQDDDANHASGNKAPQNAKTSSTEPFKGDGTEFKEDVVF